MAIFEYLQHPGQNKHPTFPFARKETPQQYGDNGESQVHDCISILLCKEKMWHTTKHLIQFRHAKLWWQTSATN